MEESLCKKNFADIMTDFVSSEKVFNDANMEYIARFQYLVIELFNKAILYYCINLGHKYKKRFSVVKDIFFTYKGGTTMKIVFDKYKKIFEGLVNYKDISEKFKRSDSDYSIFINPRICDKEGNSIFLEVYKDINKISAWCLAKIKEFIVEHPDYIVPLSLVKEDDIKGILHKMNSKLTYISNNKDDSFNYCYKLRNLDSIIGMSYFDKHYLLFIYFCLVLNILQFYLYHLELNY